METEIETVYGRDIVYTNGKQNNFSTRSALHFSQLALNFSADNAIMELYVKHKVVNCTSTFKKVHEDEQIVSYLFTVPYQYINKWFLVYWGIQICGAGKQIGVSNRTSLLSCEKGGMSICRERNEKVASHRVCYCNINKLIVQIDWWF